MSGVKVGQRVSITAWGGEVVPVVETTKHLIAVQRTIKGIITIGFEIIWLPKDKEGQWFQLIKT
jgi:hypothetical protein